MFPMSTLEPAYSQLDKKIVPLVKVINKLGLPTYHSCEGHGNNRGLIQSPFPVVVITPDFNPDGAWQWLRFMGMLGVYNSNLHYFDDVRWTVLSIGNQALEFSLKPADICQNLEDMQKSIILLTQGLRRIDKWYKSKNI